jgi:hypothetical protein
MATDLAGTVITRLFSYEPEVQAFRQWQDTAMVGVSPHHLHRPVQDVSVYMMITTGLLVTATKPIAKVIKLLCMQCEKT